MTKPVNMDRGIVKLTDASMNTLSQLDQTIPYDTVPFHKTGLGTETVIVPLFI